MTLLQNQPYFYLDEILDRFLSGMLPTSSKQFIEAKYPNYPPMNHFIGDNGTSVFEFAAQGLKKEDIKIEIEGNVLKISAEPSENRKPDERDYLVRRLSKRGYNLGFKFSDKADLDKIKVSLEDGILRIEVPPKPDAIPKRKTIYIE